VLEQIFVFPAGWESPPRVYRLAPGWEANLVTEDGQFRLDGSTVVAPPSLYDTVNSRRVESLETSGGELRRVGGELVVNGTAHPIRALPQGVSAQFEAGFLYRYLLGDGAGGEISP
jgi:hypothetical protein